MTDGQTDVQQVNDLIDAAMDERGPKSKTRRVLSAVIDEIGIVALHKSIHGWRDIQTYLLAVAQDSTLFVRLTEIIAEPEPGNPTLAAYNHGLVDESRDAAQREAVEAAEAETAGPVARLNVGLLSRAKAGFVNRICDAEANGTHMIRLGFIKAVIAEVTEGTP